MKAAGLLRMAFRPVTAYLWLASVLRLASYTGWTFAQRWADVLEAPPLAPLFSMKGGFTAFSSTWNFWLFVAVVFAAGMIIRGIIMVAFFRDVAAASTETLRARVERRWATGKRITILLAAAQALTLLVIVSGLLRVWSGPPPFPLPWVFAALLGLALQGSNARILSGRNRLPLVSADRDEVVAIVAREVGLSRDELVTSLDKTVGSIQG